MLPPIGIWKDIRLEGWSIARLDDVHLRQGHEGGDVTLEIGLTVERRQEMQLLARMEITTPDGRKLGTQADLATDQATLQILVEGAELWWPNGYGKQPLYQVDVLLLAGAKVCDRWMYQIGLRTVELRQVADQWGRSFTFVVNGVPIFAKGSNWIPADSFPTRISDEHLEHLICSAAESHQNVLRVWGGGFYEEERFYDLCDRYGILVWQDCIFSCSIYPLDEEAFLDNVRVEIEENVRRLRHRASLALWCGNNEMEWGWESWGWAKLDFEDQLLAVAEQIPALQWLAGMAQGRELLSDWRELREAYDAFFHATLPAWIAKLDPDTPYWPSSPSSDTPFQNANAETQGDAHYWGVWHGREPFTAYRAHYPRFMSEFGFQSLPPLKTIAAYAEEADWNLTSYVMEHHQRGNHGNGLIISQMTETFRMPKDFPALVYLSMILQAEGIRYGVEHWRRHMERVRGTLYWQLNDCWPVASWASLDYFGRWKALHYAARRFYAPLLLSIEDAPPKMGIHVSSDLTELWEGTVAWSLETVEGVVLRTGHEAVRAAPLRSTSVCDLDFSEALSDAMERRVVLVCELLRENERVALVVAPFVPNKHLALTLPALSTVIEQQGDRLLFEVSARSLARFVELALEGTDVVFSDNYFDVPGGRTVTLDCPLPEGWTLARARAELRTRSLYDSFA
jgi:beta-mannosidase